MILLQKRQRNCIDLFNFPRYALFPPIFVAYHLSCCVYLTILLRHIKVVDYHRLNDYNCDTPIELSGWYLIVILYWYEVREERHYTIQSEPIRNSLSTKTNANSKYSKVPFIVFLSEWCFDERASGICFVPWLDWSFLYKEASYILINVSAGWWPFLWKVKR